MKKAILALFMLTMLAFQSFAGKGDNLNYMVANIPEDLKKDADAVVREELTQFEVLSLGVVKTTYKKAITIFNKKGSHHAKVYVHYDEDLSEVHYINAKVYNALGIEIETLKKKDINDLSAYDGISLASSSRIKKFDLTKGSYPYTIYYEYSETSKNAMFYPSWYAQEYLNTAVQLSMFRVVIPEDMKLHYKESNLPEEATIQNADGNQIYTWKATDLQALKSEPYGDVLEENSPYVWLRPDEFEIKGYKGNFDTWQNMGLLMNQLTQGKDDLPAETATKIKEIIQGTSSKKEQVKKVYEYLQQNTRYVSIQLGIGGWQPFSASFVDQNSYGDCKALSNYMHSALKSIDIPSFYTLVRAGDGENIDKDFPARQFNHAFLCVPLEQDTLWLECTSQTNPFNYLGSFTDDRDVLLCTPEGGKIVHTRVYKAEDNLQNRTAAIIIDESGKATASIKEKYTALQQEHLEHLFFEGQEEQKKALYEHFDIPSFTIDSYELDWQKSEIPTFTVDAELAIPNCASKSGKRLFIKPNLLSKWTYIPKKVEERKSKIYLDMSYLDTDTVMYTLPSNYHLEYLPKPVSIQNQFGSYESKMEMKDGKLIYTRKMIINKGKYSKGSYQELLDFYKKIKKSDKAKAVFVDKT